MARVKMIPGRRWDYQKMRSVRNYSYETVGCSRACRAELAVREMQNVEDD